MRKPKETVKPKQKHWVRLKPKDSKKPKLMPMVTRRQKRMHWVRLMHLARVTY